MLPTIRLALAAPVLLVAIFALGACKSAVLKPVTVVATGGSANAAAGDAAKAEVEKARAAETALKQRLSKVGAEVNASRSAVPLIPAEPATEPVKKALDASLAQAQAENPVEIDPNDARVALERLNLNLTKDYAKAEASYAVAKTEAEKAKLDLARAEGERDAARKALDAAVEAARIERDAQAKIYQSRLDSLAASVQSARDEAANAERKSFMRKLNWGLLGFAGVCALVGLATLYLTQGREIVRAGIAFGIGLLAGGVAYAINQPWFATGVKWVAGGATLVVLVAVGIWVWSERKGAIVAKAKEKVLADAEIIRGAARKTVTALDQLKQEAPDAAKLLVEKLRDNMDEAEKTAIHALRFEASTEIKAPSVA